MRPTSGRRATTPSGRAGRNVQRLWQAISTAMTSWHEGKVFIEHAVAIDHDALHIIAGLLIWLAICRGSSATLLRWKPFLWTFAIASWNEAVDLWVDIWPEPGRQFGEGFKDLMLTVIGPAIVIAGARLWPSIFSISRNAAAAAPDAEAAE